MRYVSYTRSTSHFKLKPIPDRVIGIQNDKIENYAKAHKFVIREKYSDRKHSFDEETAFQKMLQDGIQRKFDCVILDSIYHCGCTLWEAREVLMETFFCANIHFIVTEDDFISYKRTFKEVELYFKEKYAEYNKTVLVERNYMNAKTNIYFPSTVPYGYQMNDGKIEPLEPYASNVKYIFKSYANGMEFKEICKHLIDTKQIKPKCVKYGTENDKDPYKWNTRTLQLIMTRKAYTGILEKKVRGEMKIVMIPQVVDSETFEKVQIKLNALPKRKIAKQVKSPFVGIVYDENTGEKLNFRKTEKGPAFMLCNTDNSHLKKTFLTETEMERLIKETLIKEKKSAKIAKANIELGRGKEFCDAKMRKLKDELKTLFNEISSKHGKIMDLNRDFQQKSIDEDEYTASYEEMEKVLKEDEKRLNEVEDKIKELKNTYSFRNKWIESMENWNEQEPFDMKSVRKVISKIVVKDFESVKIVPAKNEWKILLPEEWMVR